MKNPANLFIAILLSFVGAALIHYVPISIPSSLSFLLGGILCSTLMLFKTTESQHVETKVRKENSKTKTLYVGNLPYRANENDVEELFSKYGEVFAVRLMKDKRTGKRRGFGFVVIAQNKATFVIEKLNNSEYQDRTLKVREANEPRIQDNDRSY